MAKSLGRVKAGLLTSLSIHEGKVTSKTIERELRVSGKLVRDAVRDLRRFGVKVCSDNDGYWLGSNEEGIQTALSMILRGNDIRETGEIMLAIIGREASK